MAAGGRSYCRVRDGDNIQRELDGLTLLYHRPSGLTHMLASPLPEILDALDDTPVTAAGLLKRLSVHYDLGGEGDALEELVAHLEELTALGLTESRACATA